MRRWTGPLLLALLAAVTTGCRDDTVRVTFRPAVGAVYRYEVTVHSRTEVRIPGETPETHDEQIVLQSEHTVLDAGPDGVRVQVILGDAAGSVRTFVVRFDRAAQLESVESDDTDEVDEVDVDDAGETTSVFGISEIFPAAAGAPPEGRLAPGERWRIDDLVSVPDAVGEARLTGEGRLVELGIEDGEEVARLVTSSTLEVSTTQPDVDGEVVLLDGQQVTEQRSAHDLRDGAVRAASSTTDGSFALEIRPPFGQLRDPVRGTLHVHVTSTTVRLD
jgi:hypothetical protein